jgi:hypothetical protein
MGLDVATPPPPELSADGSVAEYDDVEVADTEGDYHREDLESFLAADAWETAFAEWTEHTDLTEEEFAVAADLALFEEFDFFWDAFADRVGYHAPGLPEDWRERDLHPDLETWETVSAINAAMTELGRTVADLLEAEYVDWEGEYEAPDDLPEF